MDYAKQYDNAISDTLPYYMDFFEQCGFEQLKWLDLGCGTGTLEEKALKRWGRYQIRHGKTELEAKEHNARCGVNYYPITVDRHIDIMRKAGFRHIHVFWYSYMQMGVYGKIYYLSNEILGGKELNLWWHAGRLSDDEWNHYVGIIDFQKLIYV